jgi:hypothetical protein
MKDVSIFQGIIQFVGRDGETYRAEDTGCGRYAVGHLVDNGYIYLCTVYIKGKATPLKIWNKLEENFTKWDELNNSGGTF